MGSSSHLLLVLEFDFLAEKDGVFFFGCFISGIAYTFKLDKYDAEQIIQQENLDPVLNEHLGITRYLKAEY